MNDAELEEFLIKLFEKRWKIIIYELSILFIAIVLFIIASSASGR